MLSRTEQEQDKLAHAREAAQCTYQCIVDMVAALECDYDRLEELRDERENAKDSVYESEDVPGQWGFTGCDSDSYETEADATAAALAAWDQENAEELQELKAAAGECESQEDAQTRIQEDPLSVEVRSGWVQAGDKMEAVDFNILLTTGGPAVRIRGELGLHSEPRRAWIEYQDWFTPWTEYVGAKQDVLLTYASQFFYGE